MAQNSLSFPVREVCSVHSATPALRHGGKGGKQHNHIDIIARCPGQNELGHAFFHPVAAFHQLHHSGNHNRGGDGPEHRAQHCRFDPRKTEQGGGKQDAGEDFARCGDKGHQHSRTAHPLEIGEVEGKAGLEQDDDQSHLTQVGGDGEDRRIEQIECVRAEYNPHGQHPEDPGNVQDLTESGGGQSGQKNERERGEHGGSSFFGQQKRLTTSAAQHRSHQPDTAVPVSRGRSSFPVILPFMIVRFFVLSRGRLLFAPFSFIMGTQQTAEEE